MTVQQLFRPPLSADEYIMWCSHCRRATIWRLVAIIAGKCVYRCQTPGCVRERT